MPDQLLTTADVCALIKINRTTLWRWCEAEKFPAPLSLNSRPRWKASTVAEYLDSLN